MKIRFLIHLQNNSTFNFIRHVIFLMLLLLNVNAESEKYESIDVDIVGYADFETSRLYLRSASSKKIFIVLEKPYIDMDDSLSDRVVDEVSAECINWFKLVTDEKPKLKDGIYIRNYDKSRKVINSIEFLLLDLIVFVLDDNQKMNGPFALKNMVKVRLMEKSDIDQNQIILLKMPDAQIGDHDKYPDSILKPRDTGTGTSSTPE